MDSRVLAGFGISRLSARRRSGQGGGMASSVKDHRPDLGSGGPGGDRGEEAILGPACWRFSELAASRGSNA